MSSAGIKSSCQSAKSHSGAVMGGKPCGTLPTSFIPWPCQSSDQAKMVVKAIATTGPALASTSASVGFKPVEISNGFKPLRTQNKNAVAAMPTSRVSTWAFEAWCTKAHSRSIKLCPSAFTPMMVFIWLSAISKPDAEMKPEITGWLKKFAKKPRRSKPIKSNMPPDKNAKVIATCQ